MEWYEEDVKAAIAERMSCRYEPKTIFYGSSSIRLWSKLYEDFGEFKPVNLGFGGSTLAACVWFFDRIVAPISNPKTLILYAGDNDLGDGRHPEEVLIFFREFMMKFRDRYPDIPFYYISIKPSVSRVEIIDKIKQTNELIEKEINNNHGNDYFVNVYDKMIGNNGRPIATLFEQDGLHLNRDGYMVWREIILNDCLLNAKSH
jgi:lysophospholipase L1-like esterase